MPERASYEEAAALIPKYLRPGLMTNLADPAGLRRDELRILKLENGLFILRRRESWEALSFLMTSGPVPELPGMVVTEIPNSQRVTGAAEIFKDAGYRVILERVRLARRARGAEESGSPDAAGSAGGFAGTEISPALPGEAEAVAELLRGSFDALTGCLPGEAQLREDIDRGLVLAARSGSVWVRNTSSMAFLWYTVNAGRGNAARMPTSSISSRSAACRAVSPASTLPPAVTSHRLGRFLHSGERRWMSSLPSGEKTHACTTRWNSPSLSDVTSRTAVLPVGRRFSS